MAGPDSPEYWVLDHRYNERLIQALVVSLVLHILVLAINLPHRAARQETGSPVLSVSFMSSNEALSGLPAISSQQKLMKATREVLTQTNPATFSLTTKTRDGVSADTSEQKSIKHETSVQVGESKSATTGVESRYVRKPGEARVILEINADGQIGQIIWDMLPAMTDEQFSRLEAAIRARGHVGLSNNNFVKETIDVRDYIGSMH